MIPKLIHYCWLSDDPIPGNLQNYLNTWRQKLPDYEFIHWNFDRFDINGSKWVKQAFESRKYAFAADYIRLYALYNLGGIYLDMDVEVIQSFDPFLKLSTMIGFENDSDKRLEVAILGVEKNSEWIYECLKYYENKSFINDNGTYNTKVLPLIVRDCLLENQYVFKEVSTIQEANNVKSKEIPIFPASFFSPKRFDSHRIEKNENTYAIHHFEGSWLPWYARMEHKLSIFLKVRYRNILYRLLQ